MFQTCYYLLLHKKEKIKISQLKKIILNQLPSF
jgi:hypothetical protein